MKISNNMFCPTCEMQCNFMFKYEASYIYSYMIDLDAPGLKNDDNFYSFLYDNRDLIKHNQYLECCNCGAKYPCNFSQTNNGATSEELKKYIYANVEERETVEV